MPVVETLIRKPSQRGLCACFPVYRPDLAKHMAMKLELGYVDLRADFMAQFGKQAGSISLDDLDQQIGAFSERSAVVINNAESLLATRSRLERVEWFTRFLSRQWQHTVILPVHLFADHIERNSHAVATIDPDLLPEQGLISRFLN